MANEIQRAFNVLAGSIGGAAAVLSKTTGPKDTDTEKVFTDVNSPGLQFTPVYDNDSAAIKATAIANEAIKSKAVRAQSARTKKIIKEEGGNK